MSTELDQIRHRERERTQVLAGRDRRTLLVMHDDMVSGIEHILTKSYPFHADYETECVCTGCLVRADLRALLIASR